MTPHDNFDTDFDPGAAASRRSPKRLALTVLALGAATATVVFGSYAAWTATTSTNNNAVTAGTLTLGNDHSATALFQTATDIAPGDNDSETVTITNDGSIPQTVVLTKSGVTNVGFGTDLTLSINDDLTGKCIYPAAAVPCGASTGAWNGALTNVALPGPAAAPQWAPGEIHPFTITYDFASTSNDGSQGATADFDLTWDGDQ